MRSFAALLAAALATGADAHAGLMNPHPRGPYSDPRYSTFLASSFAEQGLTAPEFLQLCPNSFAGEVCFWRLFGFLSMGNGEMVSFLTPFRRRFG